MKKFKVLASVLLMSALTLTACGESTEVSSVKEPESVSESVSEAEPASEAEVVTYTVGICNYVDDASLNQIVSNIESRLAEIEGEQNVKFNISYDNCNADANVLSQIVANFTADKVDIMVGVATPVAMTMQAATEDTKIPVVFAAVSDPVGAGLVDSLNAPGSNLTGTSDALNTASVIDLIFATNPEITKVGLLYDLGQDSSTAAIKEAKEILEAKNIEVVERTGTNVDEVVLAAQALVNDGVQAVFTPTDNTIMQAELSIYEIFADAGILHFAGADSFALNGAFFGYGVNYANLGQETADMVADILINEKNPAEVPVRTFDNGIATINTDVADKLGYTFADLTEKYASLCSKVQEITTAESFE